MKKTKISLGGIEYEIREKPSRKNAEYRELIEAKFEQVANILDRAPNTEVTGSSMAGLVREVSQLVVGSVDIVVELLFAYSPDLEKDREHIINECYDSEIVNAFMGVLSLAYPFGSLVKMLARVNQSGQVKPKT